MSNRILAFTFLLAAGAAAAQNTHKSHHETGYRMSKMPAPPLRTGLGATSLRMTTKSDKAQQYFMQGVELLHCFWDFEAYRAFKEAARLDPDAPMAWWGMVQSISDYNAMEEEKKAALKKIEALLPKGSDHEQYYLRALQKQQEDKGHDGWKREMEALIEAYPDDTDAKLFLAIGNDYGYDDDGRPGKGGVYSLMLVRDVLARDPENAAANHYLIHLLESGPHAGRALDAAAKLGRLAPASGHMVHMPGHIYYKLGDQERAREAFLASKKVDEEYMEREHVKTLDDWNYAHNLSYLAASDAEAGRFHEALEVAAKIDQLPANPFLALGRPTHAITIGSTTARLQLRFGHWQQVIDHPAGIGDEKTAGPAAVAFRDGVLAYARGMKALDDQRLADAEHESNALDALEWRLKSDADPDDEDAKPDPVLHLLDAASLDLRGSLLCARGRVEEGLVVLEKAVEKEEAIGYREPPQYSRPELESLGYARLNAGQYAKAREAFEKELKARPGSGHALYGIALADEKAGRKAEAATAYARFLEAWKSADRDLPQVRHALGQVQ